MYTSRRNRVAPFLLPGFHTAISAFLLPSRASIRFLSLLRGCLVYYSSFFCRDETARFARWFIARRARREVIPTCSNFKHVLFGRSFSDIDSAYINCSINNIARYLHIRLLYPLLSMTLINDKWSVAHPTNIPSLITKPLEKNSMFYNFAHLIRYVSKQASRVRRRTVKHNKMI